MTPEIIFEAPGLRIVRFQLPKNKREPGGDDTGVREYIEVADGVGLDERTVEWHLLRAARKLETASTLRKHVLRAVGPGRSRGKESNP